MFSRDLKGAAYKGTHVRSYCQFDLVLSQSNPVNESAQDWRGKRGDKACHTAVDQPICTSFHCLLGRGVSNDYHEYQRCNNRERGNQWGTITYIARS
jgi:hypothetical protein